MNEMEAKNAQSQLELAYERIEELESELVEKTKLVNELLLSKDEILNSRFKDLISGGGVVGSTDNVSTSMTSDGVSGSQQTTSAHSSFAAHICCDDIRRNVDAIQARLSKLFEYAILIHYSSSLTEEKRI